MKKKKNKCQKRNERVMQKTEFRRRSQLNENIQGAIPEMEIISRHIGNVKILVSAKTTTGRSPERCYAAEAEYNVENQSIYNRDPRQFSRPTDFLCISNSKQDIFCEFKNLSNKYVFRVLHMLFDSFITTRTQG